MSKMLKLLKDSENIRNNSSFMKFSNKGVLDDKEEDFRYNAGSYEFSFPKDDSLENNYDTQESIFNFFTPTRVSMILMIFVSIVIISSLYVSYTALQEISASKRISMNLKSSFQKQEEKIVKLQNSTNDLKKSAATQKNSSKSLVSLLNTRTKANIKTIDEIELNYELLKVQANDLKISDRLLLDKMISLNDRLIEIENQLKTDGRNI